MVTKQNIKVISISESPIAIPFLFINKDDPSLSFILLVDKLAMDTLTISDIEEKLDGEFENGTLVVTGAYDFTKIDTTKNMKYAQMISPLYWELQPKIKVEVDPKLKTSGFYLNIGPRMRQMDFYHQVHKRTKIEKNSFYLTLVKGSKHMRVSRNSSYAFEPQDLTGATLALKKLPEPGKMAVTVEVEQKKTVLKVAPEFTVREVIEYIDIETKVPSSIIKLIYDSEIRNDENQTLKELGVKTGETFEILRGGEMGGRLDEGVMNESFGIKFVEMDNQGGPERKQWATSAPRWRIASLGLSRRHMHQFKMRGLWKLGCYQQRGRYII